MEDTVQLKVYNGLYLNINGESAGEVAIMNLGVHKDPDTGVVSQAVKVTAAELDNPEEWSRIFLLTDPEDVQTLALMLINSEYLGEIEE